MFLALAEIRRSLGRFALLTSAVALLVLLLLFFQAVGGTLTGGLTAAFDAMHADVFVYDDRARRNPSASVLPANALAAVEGVDGVADAAPVGIGVFTAAGAGADGDVDVALLGTDIDGPGLPRDVGDGRLSTSPGEAVFSGTQLDSGGYDVGDRVTVGGVDLQVVGVAQDASFSLLPTFYVGFDDYAAAVRARVGVDIEVPAAFVAVTVDEGADATTVAAAVTSRAAGLEAVDRATAIDSLPGVGQVAQSFSILYLLLYVVVTIVTGVFFLILTVQKSDALVLLRAVGASRRDVVRPVLIQVGLVVGGGAVLGAALTTGLLAAAQDTFGATLSASTLATTVAAILLLGLVASLGAVRRVLAVDPVNAVTPGGL